MLQYKTFTKIFKYSYSDIHIFCNIVPLMWPEPLTQMKRLNNILLCPKNPSMFKLATPGDKKQVSWAIYVTPEFWRRRTVGNKAECYLTNFFPCSKTRHSFAIAEIFRASTIMAQVNENS